MMRLHKAAVSFAALAVSACIAPAPAQVTGGTRASAEIPCLDPPFTANASLATLRQRLGEENVIEQTFETEGDPITLTIVYPNNARRRLEISWRDEDNRQGIYKVGIAGDSDWTGPRGVALGMAIEEAQRLNGVVFDIRGLGWDYGGDVADWRGGALAQASGGCRVNASFGVGNEAAMLYPPEQIMGDRIVASNSEALRAVALRLVSLTYVYPER